MSETVNDSDGGSSVVESSEVLEENDVKVLKDIEKDDTIDNVDNSVADNEEEEEEEDDNWSESSSSEDDEEDEDLIFITSSNHRQHEKRGVGGFQSRGDREEGDGDGEGDDDDEDKKAGNGHDELRDLRFTYHRTAFDIDLDDLDEHSWRLPHTDVSDYFNFGFNEPTWRSYCAKQLKHRAAQGLGPSSSQSNPSASISSGVLGGTESSSMSAVAALLAAPVPPPPQPLPPHPTAPPPAPRVHGLPPPPPPPPHPASHPSHMPTPDRTRAREEYWQESSHQRPRY